jgi:hypothetical protein
LSPVGVVDEGAVVGWVMVVVESATVVVVGSDVDVVASDPV